MSFVPEPESAAASIGAPGAAPVPAPAARTSVATDLALVATGAAFVAVCALGSITVPNMAVPITLQTFGVMLVGAVLGARRGALAVLLYLAVGLAGLPVFAQGTGGLGVLGKPSLGYLLAFPIAAALAGFLVHRTHGLRPGVRPFAVFGSLMAASLLVIHPLGISVMGARLGMSAGEAVAAGAVFLPGDLIKNALAAVVATAVFRAFPDLARRG
ncbi:biotin operon repressor [Actinotalea ferrariae CF5-4]|uniref:Biotin transporter n=1 Tax=Actinotalea ferrariae CF5-4 TaxID=948458 RepID=A0A021VPB2_9CELL|nr:biotin transporter BioY [Actinotalea ferrariae]EYR63029.1 biotin operon repressor [Actinotalea ferrariae CF5-4]